MGRVQTSITVDLPVSTVYNQWTQFEEFPEFMERVESVTQLDDRRLHWVAEIGGRQREWDAEIVDQAPDQRVEWRAIDGKTNAGVVTFQPEGADRTKVNVEIEYHTEGAAEKVADAMGIIEDRVEGDLKRFKKFIEARGVETGAWRGRI